MHLAAAVQPALRDLAMPVLRRLAEETGCTSYLAVADGEEVLALAVAEPSLHRPVRRLPRRGAAPDAHGRLGAGHQLGRDGSTTAYATTHGERYPGATSLAAPIRDLAGVDACVGILTPLPSSTPRTVGPQVVAAAAALASRVQ